MSLLFISIMTLAVSIFAKYIPEKKKYLRVLVLRDTSKCFSVRFMVRRVAEVFQRVFVCD